VDAVVTAGLRTCSRLKSFRLKPLVADIARGVRSFFSPSETYDDGVARKRIIIVGAVTLTIVAMVCAKLFWPSPSGGAEGVKLVAPTTQDANGDTWSLQLLKGQAAETIARAGVEPGPPLLIIPEAEAYGRTVVVSVTVKGQAGEKYVPGVKKNGQWLPAPAFRLISDKGKVIGAGRFKYG